jgi:predicted ATPase/class 3 adenylate cyclase/Tfp pilus assembly protein PilF
MHNVHTLLLTDIVDSTAINSRLGDAAMSTLWEQHDRGSRELARQFSGTEVDRSDGFLMLFDDAEAALGFVMAYHRFLAALPVPLQARAGLHIGPLTLHHRTPDDIHWGGKPLEVVGIAKAMTARLMSLAGAGQTLASGEVAQALAGSAQRCHRHGHWRFKGIDEPVEVFEVGDDHAPFMPPPDAEKAHRVVERAGQWVATRDVPRHLPAERDSFHGRSAELRRIAALFGRGERLVVLHGPGGVGKTRLALRHAWGWLGGYPGGVYFCDLASAASADGLLHAVGRAFGMPLGSEPVAELAGVIAGHGDCLVVLDNFEQIVALAPATLGHWLDAAPTARFLVTSRDGMGLAGEQRVEVEPLAEAPAITLFHDRALAVDPNYDAARIDATVMRSLVSRLDGLPLALELAAARAAVLPPATLLQRIEDRFRLLTSRGGRPARQATLRAAIDWSWDGLAASEKAALAQLSVFDDGFTLAAAEAVVDAGGPGADAIVADCLQALVDRSLVRRLHNGRFGLLVAIKAYAAEKLPAFDEAAALARHAAYFAGWTEADATAERCADVGNLVAACRQAAAAGQQALAAQLLQLSWAALRLTGPFRAGVELAAACRDLSGAEVSSTVVAIEWVAGAARYVMGELDAAREHVQRGLAALDGTSPARLAARLHGLAGELAAQGDDPALADEHLRVGLAFADESADASTRCQLLNALGATASDRGQLGLAEQHYEAALRIAEAAGLPAWRGGLLGNLGWLHHATGRLDQAREAFEGALDLAQASGDRRWEGNARCNLGLIHHEQGRHAQARVELERSLEIAQRIGHVALECTVTCNLGLVCEALGDLPGACRLHAAALSAAASLGDTQMQAQLQAYLASTLARSGRAAEAVAGVQAGHAMVQPGNVPVRALLACAEAEAAIAAGDPDAAGRALATAQALQREMGLGPETELGRWVGRVVTNVRG